MKKYFCLCILLTVALNIFCISCSDYVKSDDSYDLGQTVTPEMLESIKDSIDSQKEADSNEIIEIGSDATLYWTVGGSKYHLYRTCSSLSRSNESNIKNGDFAAVSESGKTEACSLCLEKCGISENELPWNVQNKTTD